MAKYFPTRRKLVESNLSLAFPHWEKSKRDNVIRDVYKHWGEMFFATLKLWFLSDRKIESIVEAEDGFKDYLIEKKKQNIPVIFFTGHFGSWEIAGRWVAMMSKGSASIYRIQMRCPGYCRGLWAVLESIRSQNSQPLVWWRLRMQRRL